MKSIRIDITDLRKEELMQILNVENFPDYYEEIEIDYMNEKINVVNITGSDNFNESNLISILIPIVTGVSVELITSFIISRIRGRNNSGRGVKIEGVEVEFDEGKIKKIIIDKIEKTE